MSGVGIGPWMHVRGAAGQRVVQLHRRVAHGLPSPAASGLVAALWANPVHVAQHWNDQPFDPLIAVAVGFTASPSAPDVSNLAVFLGSATDGAGQGVTCVQALSLPSL